MGNRNFGIFLIILLFSLSCVVAEDFNVNIVPIRDKISSNESAIFNLTIENSGPDDRFTLSIKDPKWSLLTEPLTHFTSGIAIKNGSSKDTLLYLTPVELAVGMYKIGFEVTSSNLKQTEEIVLSTSIGSYVAGKPVVFLDVELVPSIILPGSKVSVKINVENKNALNLKNLSLSVFSNLINKEESFDLLAYEKKIIELTSDINKSTETQEDNIRIIVKEKNDILGETNAILSVLTSLPVFKEETVSSTGFLKSVNEITITNDGNARIIQSVKIPGGFFVKMFTSTEPKAASIDEAGIKYLSWNVDLKAGESTTVVVTRDYRSFSMILLLIVAIVIAYFMLRPSLYIKKITVKTIKKSEGIDELNVLLKIKNRSNKEIQEVNVEDCIPKISELVKEEYIGTLAPTSIFKHESKGTVLRWDIGKLESKEERLLRYKLKSKLSILGTFYLPGIKAKYIEEGKKIVIYGGRVKIVG